MTSDSSLAEEEAWRGDAPFTVLELARGEGAAREIVEAARAAGEDMDFIGAVASSHNSFEFAERLWTIFGQGEVEPGVFWPEDLEARILDAPGHHLFWLGMEQVHHDVVIEARDGAWRIFQAMDAEAKPKSATTSAKEPGFAEFGGVLVSSADTKRERGYTSKAWSSPWKDKKFSSAAGAAHDVVELPLDCDEAPEELPEVLQKARRHWGGGRSLSRSEAKHFLLLVRQLKELSQEVAAKLKAETKLAKRRDGEVADWAREAYEDLESFSLTNSRPSSPRSGPGYAETDELWILAADNDAAKDLDISLSTKLGYEFMRKFADITGEYPSARCFLTLLQFLDWPELEREDGGRAGWTFRARNLRASTNSESEPANIG